MKMMTNYCIKQMFVSLGQYDIPWDDRVRLGNQTEGIKLRSECTVQVDSLSIDV